MPFVADLAPIEIDSLPPAVDTTPSAIDPSALAIVFTPIAKETFPSAEVASNCAFGVSTARPTLLSYFQL